MRQFMIAASGKHKSVGAFRRTPFLLALVNPYGHRHPQGQIQEAKGEVFCSHFLHAGQCRVQMWSAVVVAIRNCTTGLLGCAIRCLAGITQK